MSIIKSFLTGLRVERYRLETTLRKSYKNCLYWYDGAEAPGAGAPDVERFAYSQREHLAAVMDELDVAYDDLDAAPATRVTPPDSSARSRRPTHEHDRDRDRDRVGEDGGES